MAQSASGAQTPTYGQKLTVGSTWKQVQNGDSITTASGQTVTVAAINTTKGNIAVASGNAAAVVGS